MHPDLISLGFLHIKTYGAFMALGFLAAWQVLAWLCRRTGRNPEPCTNLIMLMMISGVVGARIAYVVEHWTTEFAGHPEMIVRVDKGGLMFYGSIIVAGLVLRVVPREARKDSADGGPLRGGDSAWTRLRPRGMLLLRMLLRTHLECVVRRLVSARIARVARAAERRAHRR